MQEALIRLVEIIEIIGKTIGLFFRGVTQFFMLIPEWLNFLQTVPISIPEVVAPFVLAGVFITIIMMIVGRA